MHHHEKRLYDAVRAVTRDGIEISVDSSPAPFPVARISLADSQAMRMGFGVRFGIAFSAETIDYTADNLLREKVAHSISKEVPDFLNDTELLFHARTKARTAALTKYNDLTKETNA